MMSAAPATVPSTAKTAAARKPLTMSVPGDNTLLANLCGPLDENLKQLANAWDVHLNRRGNRFTLQGKLAHEAARALQWFAQRAQQHALSIDDIQLGVVELQAALASGASGSSIHSAADHTSTLQDTRSANVNDLPGDELFLRTRRSDLRPRTPRQRDYIRNILRHDITFGIGPAGTGKTWLAVACAIDALERETVQRLVLTRPAVEAGERLGFLPGDLAQKVDPYLRPLYDALYDLMGFERVQRLFEKQTMEIAPLAYMRGRTLNHAFVILDEAQNTTPEQMKMFLTRIGFGSKAVITGDPSQVDLPRGQLSGLGHAVEILSAVQGIATTTFTSRDVVRHPLVARIIDAYGQQRDSSNGNHGG